MSAYVPRAAGISLASGLSSGDLNAVILRGVCPERTALILLSLRSIRVTGERAQNDRCKHPFSATCQTALRPRPPSLSVCSLPSRTWNNPGNFFSHGLLAAVTYSRPFDSTRLIGLTWAAMPAD